MEHVFWGNVVVTSLCDKKGNITGFTKITHDITEQTQREKELRKYNEELEKKVKEHNNVLFESEKKYRLLFANNPMPMWVLDLETFHILDVNEVAAIHYGYSREEFMSLTSTDIRVDEQKELFNKSERSRIVSPENYNRGIWKHRKKDGTVIDMEVFGHDILFEGKNARLVIAHDVTEQKIAEEKLAGSERCFRALIENSFDAISLHDENGHALYQSPSTKRITGYSIEETMGKDVAGFFHPDDIEAVTSRMEAAAKSPGKPIFGMHRMRHKDGHYIWTEGTTTNLLHDKDVNAFVGNFRDITERKLAEDKVIDVNRLYVFISKVNNMILHVNDEQTLFNEACRIAVDVGQFDISWIGIPDIINKLLNPVAQSNATAGDTEFLISLKYDDNGPTAKVLRSGKYHVINDFECEPSHHTSRKLAGLKGYKSLIVLPVKKAGKTIGTYNLFSKKNNFFDRDEIRLLEKISEDISFALDVFENDKKRRQIEDKLKYNELRLRQAQAIAHFGNWELDFSTGISIWSEEACRIYGLAPDDNRQSYQKWLSFIHPDDLEYVMMVTGEGKRTLTNSSFYHRMIRKDGAIRQVFSKAMIEFDLEGVPIGLYGVMHDITEIKEAEKALQQSETNLKYSELRHKQAQAIAHFGSWELNFSTGISYWSEETCRIYGLAPNDNTQSLQSWQSFIHPDDLEYVLKVTGEAQRTQNGCSLYYRIIRKDGSIRHVFSKVLIEFNLGGLPVGLYGVEHDITEIKEAEKALEQSEANLRLIMDLIPQPIFVKDYEGKNIFANKSYAALSGLTPEQVTNNYFKDTIPVKSEAEFYLAQDREVILSGKTKIISEHSFTDYKGAKHLFRTVKVPFTIAGTDKKSSIGCHGGYY